MYIYVYHGGGLGARPTKEMKGKIRDASYVCVCVYMHTYMHTLNKLSIYVCIYIYMYINIYTLAADCERVLRK